MSGCRRVGCVISVITLRGYECGNGPERPPDWRSLRKATSGGAVILCVVSSVAATPGHRTPANAGLKLPAETLSCWEVRQLLAQCSSTVVDVRNRALIATLYRTGVKPKEALELERVDLVIGESLICAPGRELGVDRDTMEMLEAWLDWRDPKFGGDGPLFCTLAGQPLQGNYVRTFLGRLAERADLTTRVHPHAFRNTFALEMLEEGVSIRDLGRLLGHSSLSATLAYVERLPPTHTDLPLLGQRRAWRLA